MLENLKQLLIANNIAINNIEPIVAGGGDRQYFRITDATKTYIGTVSTNAIENKTFFSFTNTLKKEQVLVPEIICKNTAGTIYVQQDLGNTCLLDAILQDGYTPENFNYYRAAVKQLAKVQIIAGKNIDYDLCLADKKFDKTAALKDLNYFITYYATPKNIEFDVQKLNAEFDTLSTQIGAIQPIHFMYRDFQGRNIMVHQEQVFFIDYQGGMQGPLQYDLASLLWQAKAQLPQDWKEDLIHIYLQSVQVLLPNVDVHLFKTNYESIVLMRLLQVLGAYGRRGLLEGKAHFISSIPQGIANIKTWQAHNNIAHNMPELWHVLQQL
jgi:aminoglycoside/choline kinase family phosphotransferase